ncbi:MAG: M14 family metallopeptidase [Thermoplasmatota archaeon]
MRKSPSRAFLMRFHLLLGSLAVIILLIISPGDNLSAIDDGRVMAGVSDVDADPDFQENFTKYFDYNSMTEYLVNLSERFPHLMNIFTIGESYEEREIWCVKLSDEPEFTDDGDPGSEPNALLVGAHHGNEWISYEVPLYVMTFLLENYGRDSRNGTVATYLLDNREIFFIPMLNVDGTQYSHDMETRWRKNREPNYLADFGPGPIGSPEVVPLSYGVDLNRNYGWMWHLDLGSNELLTSGGTYRGPPDNRDNDGDAVIQIDLTPGRLPFGPDEGVDEDPWDGVDNDDDGKVDEDPAGGFSSLETIAMKNLGETIDFPVAISYHSFSELVLWPWGSVPEPAPDAELLETLGMRMAEMNGYEPMQGYDLYMASGEMSDWFYSQHGTLAYTFEIGRTHAIPGEEIAEHAELNLDPTLYLCYSASNPYGSYLRINDSTVYAEEVREGIRVDLSIPDSGYPLAFDESSSELMFRSYDGFWRSAPASIDQNGNWTAVVPRQFKGADFDFYFILRDSEGGEVIEPMYAPLEFHRYVTPDIDIWDIYFGFDTVLVMFLTLGTIWGGFVGGIVKAMKAQKRRSEGDGVG